MDESRSSARSSARGKSQSVLITDWRVTRTHPRSPSNWMGACPTVGSPYPRTSPHRVSVSAGARGGAAAGGLRSGMDAAPPRCCPARRKSRKLITDGRVPDRRLRPSENISTPCVRVRGTRGGVAAGGLSPAPPGAATSCLRKRWQPQAGNSRVRLGAALKTPGADSWEPSPAPMPPSPWTGFRRGPGLKWSLDGNPGPLAHPVSSRRASA
jgi:hypothetical protein